jgi:hypothetical protein
MTTDIDFKVIERNTHRALNQDGILDLALGLSALYFGILLFFKQEFGFGMVFPIVWGLVIWLKLKITYPRIGFVILQQEKARLNRFLLICVLISVVILATIVYVFFSDRFSEKFTKIFEIHLETFMTVFIIILALGIVLFYGRGTAGKRFYLYSGLVIVVFLISKISHFKLEYFLIPMGAVMTSLGGALFYKFIKKYPKPSAEVNSNG